MPTVLDSEPASARLQTGIPGRNAEDAAAPATPALLLALRDGTRAAHAQLEAMPGMARLLSAELTHTDYVWALQCLRNFHLGLRRAVSPFAPRFAPFDARGSAGLDALTADLAWFDSTAAAQPASVPVPADALSALGTLYVLEGSALGGRVIGRAVAVSLGVSPGFGGSFFCGVTADAARMRWLDFTSLLARASTWPEAGGATRAVEAALAAFACFERVVVPAYEARGPGLSGLPQIDRARVAMASPGFAAPAHS